jgi:hypothetical protein
MNTGRREWSQAASLLLCFLFSLAMSPGPAHLAQAKGRTGTVMGPLVDPQGAVLLGVP